MKKLILIALAAVLVLVVTAVVVVALYLDTGIKRGVETVGPMVTKTDVKLASVSLSILSGSGKVKGFVIGNPEGFKSASAINIGSAHLSVQPGSIFSDKVVIKSVRVDAPEITYETDLRNNNLNKLMANVQSTTGGSGGQKDTKPATTPKDEAKASKKLQVDEFVITGGKINVSLTTLGGKSMTVPLPEIRLSNLGQGSEGITSAELFKVVLAAIEKEAVPVATAAATDLVKSANELVKDASKTVNDIRKDPSNAVNAVDKLGHILNKKK